MLYANNLIDAALAAATLPSPNAFTFESAPLSTVTEAALGVVIYLSVLALGTWIMWVLDAKPLQLKPLFFVHNTLLSLGSGFLLLAFAEILWARAGRGFVWNVCAKEAYTSRLEFLYYINYLFKYYELLDTVFLVLKRKQLEFLHVYHHALTMVLCFVELRGKAPVQWVVIVLNLAVHFIMYYYYARSVVVSKPPWWKKHLTSMQITQFVIDLVVIYVVSYSYYLHTYHPTTLAHTMPNLGPCTGTDEAALVGVFILTSYLGLFIQFFIKTYSAKRSSKEKGKNKAE
ncbi:GNS1/SUR4 membrane protein [Cladochytrium replicatum]|nr:GNS1/SUR4 membrane protein [Cladochytrium replicatum]